MARIVEHRCASCGTLAGTARRRRPGVGAPFCVCPQCGAYVQRRPYDEWALMGARARLELLAGGIGSAGALGLLPALGYALLCIARGRPAPPEELAIGAAAGFLVAVSVWGARFAAALRRSRRRMADPMYQARLVEFGMASPPRG